MRKKIRAQVGVLSAITFLACQALALPEVELLQRLVKIPSGSYQITGVEEVQNLFAHELQKLGFQIEKTPYPGNALGPLVVGTLIKANHPFITFLVHADTVFDEASGFSDFQLNVNQKTAKGPGVIDNKGGMVVLLAGLKEFLSKNKTPKFSMRVISSPGEEVGTPSFIPLFEKYSQESSLVLGFEPCLEGGGIVDSRRGNRWYEISVKGQDAHAGRDHKKGINACWELSKKLDAISKLTDYSKDLTVSIGSIVGGQDKFNIVCGEAVAKVDVRFSSIETRDLAHKRIEKVIRENTVKSAESQKQSVSSYKIVDDTPPFSPTKLSLEKIRLYKKLIKDLEGRDIQSNRSGGAADSNIFSRPGLAIIDGLGACGGNMHTNEELIELPSLKTRAKALSQFLELQ